MTRHFLRDDDLSAAEQAHVIQRAIAMKADPFADQAARRTARRRRHLRQAVDPHAGVLLRRRRRPGRLPAGHRRRHQPARPRRADRRHRPRPRPPGARRSSGAPSATTGSSRWPPPARVPVVNALTDEFHPCQILADLMTVTEHKGATAGLSLAYLGDGANNMAHSYLLGGAPGRHARTHRRTGRATCPTRRSSPGAEELARSTAGRSWCTTDAAAAVSGADVVATDTWVSMGQEAREGDARRDGQPVRAVRRGRRRPGARGGRRDRAALPARLPRHGDLRRRSSTGRSRSSGTRRRTGCTPRRRCCPSSWSRRDRHDARRPAPADRRHPHPPATSTPRASCSSTWPATASRSPRRPCPATSSSSVRSRSATGRALVYAVPGEGGDRTPRAAVGAHELLGPAAPAVRGAARHRGGVGQPGGRCAPRPAPPVTWRRRSTTPTRATSWAPSPVTTRS